MPYQLKAAPVEQIKADLYVLGAFEGEEKVIGELAPNLAKYLNKKLQSYEFKAKKTDICWLTYEDKSTCLRFLIVGCGQRADFSEQPYLEVISTALKAIAATAAKRICVGLSVLPVRERQTDWAIIQFVQKQAELAYDYKQRVSEKKSARSKTGTYLLAVPKATQALQRALDYAKSLISGMDYAKLLGDLPPNTANPTYLAKQAKKLASQYDRLYTSIVDEAKMRELKMGALLAVSAGSDTPAKLIVMQYKGAPKSQAPIALVGKGVTFDAGGLSMKTPAAMIGMKYDMAGAASVFGAMKSVAELNLPVNLVGVIPATENMVNGKATRPSDVVTSMSGQTIEILNTDAEGRLALCDAMTYARGFKPAVMIDVATLTGAIIIALGSVASGLMSNDQGLADDLLKAGNKAYDRLWQLPLWEDFQPGLDSPYADMRNIANDVGASSIVASAFLARFTKGIKWAHLDVAGTAMSTNPDKGATARPVPLLLQYIADYCET